MREKSLVYSEKEFGKIDGKVANGLARYSEQYEIVGIIDNTKAGLDAGEVLDGIKNNIPIFKNIEKALHALNYTPENFIYGLAPLTPFLNKEQRGIIINAMAKRMNIINGLPEYFTEDDEFENFKNDSKRIIERAAATAEAVIPLLNIAITASDGTPSKQLSVAIAKGELYKRALIEQKPLPDTTVEEEDKSEIPIETSKDENGKKEPTKMGESGSNL